MVVVNRYGFISKKIPPQLKLFISYEPKRNWLLIFTTQVTLLGLDSGYNISVRCSTIKIRPPFSWWEWSYELSDPENFPRFLIGIITIYEVIATNRPISQAFDSIWCLCMGHSRHVGVFRSDADCAPAFIRLRLRRRVHPLSGGAKFVWLRRAVLQPGRGG